MNSITACRFAAAFVSAALLLPVRALPACATPTLTPQERLAQVRDLDRAAQAAMQQRNFGAAVAKLTQALCLAPDSSRVAYGLGMAQAAAGDFAAARNSLYTADRLQPGSNLPLVMLVRVNYTLHDIEALKANLRDAARRFPKDAEFHAVLARFLAESKLFDLALAESLRAPTAGPSAKVELAVLENTIGAFQESIRNALAVEQDPSAPAAVQATAAGIAGLSYEAAGQHQEAVRHLQHSIQLDPARENSYLALAQILENAQQPSDAAAILAQGRRALPNAVALLTPLGVDLVRSERYQDAINILKEAIRANPDDDQAYLNIAAASRNTGDVVGEIHILEELYRRLPQQPMIHVLLARALLNADPVDYAKVNEQLNLAAQANPNDADLFYLRGKVAVAGNQFDRARQFFELSIQLRPMDPAPYYQLGRLLQKLGETALAKENLDRAVLLGEANSTKPR